MYWSFSISPSNEYSELISLRIDWFNLLAVQRTLKSLLQYHSSKASILQLSAFFTVQLLHLYMTTGKIIALTKQTFVGKLISLLFEYAMFVIAVLPRSKCLNFVASVTIRSDFGAQENSRSLFSFFPIYLPWSDETRYIVMDTVLNIPVLKKVDLMCCALTTHTKKRTQETMMDIFIILIVVIVSWLFAYVQTHQVVYTKYLQFFVYQLYFNNAV